MDPQGAPLAQRKKKGKKKFGPHLAQRRKKRNFFNDYIYIYIYFRVALPSFKNLDPLPFN